MRRLNIDKYLSGGFEIVGENCWHLVAQGWKDLTGEDLGHRTSEDMLRAAIAGEYSGAIPFFTKLDRPADPCIVLMRSPGVIPHVGLFHKRRVLQVTKRGRSYVPLNTATAGYDDVSFYQ